MWLLDLDAPIQSREVLLATEEVERARRLKDSAARRRATHRFALTRLILARILGVAPGSVAYVYGVCGKPKVVPSPRRLGVEGDIGFNVSHSENVLAMVVAFGQETGVDVEVVDRAKGTARFYREWTTHEAVSKLAGTGIALRGGAPIPASVSVRSLRLSLARKEVVLSVAASEPAELPDPYQGVYAENTPLE